VQSRCSCCIWYELWWSNVAGAIKNWNSIIRRL